jgi:drug/metabolite transporter (DMT)-like permease
MDGLLLLMVVIWGVNYSVLKRAFLEVPPQAFNAVRISVASLIFLGGIRWVRRRRDRVPKSIAAVFFTPHPLTARDRWDLVWVGLAGHLLYQYFFVRGVALTKVANAAVLIGSTPALVAVLSWIFRLERISRIHWLGVAVSLGGIYLVVGGGMSFGGPTGAGDALVAIAAVCWAVYTIGSGRLVERHSPLYVTGVTMAIGGLPYAALNMRAALAVDWTRVSWWILPAASLSALLALCVAYVIWYAAIQRLGSARTSIYVNLVPIAAMIIAAFWLYEPIGAGQIVGTVAVLIGVALTRMGRTKPGMGIEE